MERVVWSVIGCNFEAFNTVNVDMIKAYRLIGHDIVEDEQSGVARAEYGKELLKQLAKKLQQKNPRHCRGNRNWLILVQIYHGHTMWS